MYDIWGTLKFFFKINYQKSRILVFLLFCQSNVRTLLKLDLLCKSPRGAHELKRCLGSFMMFICQAQVYKFSQRAELFMASQKSQQLQTHGKDFERNNKNNERHRIVLNSKYQTRASQSGKNRLRLLSVLKKTWFPCLPSLRGTEWNYIDSSNQNGFFIIKRLSCENSLPQDLPNGRSVLEFEGRKHKLMEEFFEGYWNTY